MSLAAAAAALAGGTLAAARPLAGGDLSEVVELRLTDGRTLVAKRGTPVEADMLRAIAAAGVRAPELVAAADGVIVMEACPHDGALGSAWASIGAGVRRLHAARRPRYGWADAHAFGPVAIPGGWYDRWPDFWADMRLRPHLPHLPPPLARRVDGLANRLRDRLPEAPPPALLHGDLWTGNLLVHQHQLTALIDPACLYGHVEVDLAMLGLFGTPSPAFWEAYGPREPGWREREPAYRLWPALVHLRLFGAGYRAMVDGLLAACGA